MGRIEALLRNYFVGKLVFLTSYVSRHFFLDEIQQAKPNGIAYQRARVLSVKLEDDKARIAVIAIQKIDVYISNYLNLKSVETKFTALLFWNTNDLEHPRSINFTSWKVFLRHQSFIRNILWAWSNGFYKIFPVPNPYRYQVSRPLDLMPMFTSFLNDSNCCVGELKFMVFCVPQLWSEML